MGVGKKEEYFGSGKAFVVGEWEPLEVLSLVVLLL